MRRLRRGGSTARGRSTLRIIALVGVFSGTMLAQGCALDFSGDNFQRLRIFFSLTEALVQGEATLVQLRKLIAERR